MSDLRGDVDWHFTKGLIQQFLKMRRFINEDVLDKEYSYYRRAVRSNELFYVVDIESIYNKKRENLISGIEDDK